MQNVVDGKSAPARMCDDCFALMQTLEDKEMPCSTPGCEGKWIWTKYQQLVSIRCGHSSPPRGFCDECHGKMREMQERQIPCRMKGCRNTWTLTAAEQMKLKGKAPQPRLCDECYKILSSLSDKELHCRIRGCRNTLIWNRFQQLEHIRGGKSIDAPPHLMCEDCHIQHNPNIMEEVTSSTRPQRFHNVSPSFRASKHMLLIPPTIFHIHYRHNRKARHIFRMKSTVANPQ